MPNLPIPSKSSTWAASLLLVGLMFVFYYVFVFPLLLEFYEHQYHDPISALPDGTSKLAGVEVTVSPPKYLYGAWPQWTYINVDNQSGESLSQVEIKLDVPAVSPMSLLPGFYEGQVLSDSMVIQDLPKGAHATGRVYIFTKTSFSTDEVKLSVTAKGYDWDIRTPDLTGAAQIDPLNALRTGLVESLLLPPPADSLLIVLVYFACWSAERKLLDDEIPQKGKKASLFESFTFTPSWWCVVTKTFGQGLLIFLVILSILILFLFASLPLFLLVIVLEVGRRLIK